MYQIKLFMKGLSLMKLYKKKAKKSKRIIALIVAASIILTSLLSYYIAVYTVKKAEETSEDNQYADIRSLLKSSKDASDEGNFDNALEYMQKAIDINASIPDLYMQRANIYITITQYQKAIDDFTKALDLNKNLTQIYALRGHLYYQTEAYSQALSDYTNALKYTPGDIDILNMRINIYLKDQKYQQALDDINQLVEDHPDNGTYHKIGGDTCFLMHNYDEAIIFYTNAIEKLTDTTEKLNTYLCRGNCYLQLTKFYDAISDYNYYLESEQTNGESFYNRGLCFLQITNYANGESDFTNAIGLNYSSDESYFQRGLCRYAQQNYNGAIEDLKKYETASSDSTDVSFIYYLADSYYKNNQPALAAPYFQKCIENKFMAGTCNYYLAGIALDAEDYEASINYYTKAIESKSQIIPSTFNRAIAYLHIGDTNSATKDFQAVIDDGSNKELSNEAANALSQMNN